jgi:hypothetical protein
MLHLSFLFIFQLQSLHNSGPFGDLDLLKLIREGQFLPIACHGSRKSRETKGSPKYSFMVMTLLILLFQSTALRSVLAGATAGAVEIGKKAQSQRICQEVN